jgi:hypothetical protein
MPEAHYHLGEAYLKKNDASKALEELRIAAQEIGPSIAAGNAVAPELEKRIQSATRKAQEMAGGAADAK